MKIIFIRHGIAEDRGTYILKGLPDQLRPVTGKGKKQLRAMVKWLVGIEPQIDQIWTSPLVRARDSTEILKENYPKAKVYEKKELEPQSPTPILINVLNGLPDDLKDSCLALVGHEPHLSQTIGSLISGQGHLASVRLKKAGIALINFVGDTEKGQSELRWLVTPKLVR